jgi:hypothetical protein
MTNAVNDGITIYECTPREAKKFIIRCITATKKILVPFLQSSPGMGKSSIVFDITNEYNLELIDHRLSTSTPEDMNGLPHFENGIATFSQFDIFPTEDIPLPEGKDGWVLFLDEFNSASKAVQAAAYKIILDRKVGQKKLHPRLRIICAGNLSSDRAIVNSLSTAMQSRLINLQMKISVREWLEDVAIPQHYDSRIIAFISYLPDNLMDFKPDHHDKTFCCPRTWEFINSLIDGFEVVNEDAPLYAGTITSGVALKFITFTKVFNDIPNYKDIVANPMTAKIGADSATKFATITHILEHFDENDFNKIITYINRLTTEVQTLFVRMMMVRFPQMRQHPDFAKIMLNVARFLYN